MSALVFGHLPVSPFVYHPSLYPVEYELSHSTLESLRNFFPMESSLYKNLVQKNERLNEKGAVMARISA